ncbi:hypothetical protein Naga_101424g1 [Nannochloropsis gaditana]|uniref:Uncharacterized protein n=1 Tax=Nannochloropsis gaditana TaxID=72520 RepID=W7T971_9STRA|nr:hypothetical protein Naga_101424g1 [Nannochloropsis gaditana]
MATADGEDAKAATSPPTPVFPADNMQSTPTHPFPPSHAAALEEGVFSSPSSNVQSLLQTEARHTYDGPLCPPCAAAWTALMHACHRDTGGNHDRHPQPQEPEASEGSIGEGASVPTPVAGPFPDNRDRALHDRPSFSLSLPTITGMTLGARACLPPPSPPSRAPSLPSSSLPPAPRPPPASSPSPSKPTLLPSLHEIQEEGAWQASARHASALVLKFNCGLIGGVTQAGLFNPWDRALYLSVKYSRPFLSVANFQRPYQGFWQVGSVVGWKGGKEGGRGGGRGGGREGGVLLRPFVAAPA